MCIRDSHYRLPCAVLLTQKELGDDVFSRGAIVVGNLSRKGPAANQFEVDVQSVTGLDSDFLDAALDLATSFGIETCEFLKRELGGEGSEVSRKLRYDIVNAGHYIL